MTVSKINKRIKVYIVCEVCKVCPVGAVGKVGRYVTNSGYSTVQQYSVEWYSSESTLKLRI